MNAVPWLMTIAAASVFAATGPSLLSLIVFTCLSLSAILMEKP